MFGKASMNQALTDMGKGSRKKVPPLMVRPLRN